MLDEKYTKNVQGEFILINIVEKKVLDKIDELIKDMDMCKCEKCRFNAAAIALNSLPPHYVTTTTGALLAGIISTEFNYQTNVFVEVMKALMIVKEHPLH
ncbi:MAG: late competence development ComFB family protein [Clostridiales bacterium]|nr:late competence development ComFB family protein [Clostridiales bacterium]